MGKSTPEAPEPPPFYPVNIPEAMRRAFEYDVAGYDWSDRDFARRFPGLVATRNQEMERAYNNLTGPLDPAIQGDFTRTALEGASGSFGGGDPLSALGMTRGSAAHNAASVSFANQLQQKEDYDRNRISELLGQNPQRSFGLGGGDIAGIAAVNTGGTNAFNQQQFQSELAGIYGQGQQGVATGQSIAAIGAMLAQLGATRRG